MVRLLGPMELPLPASATHDRGSRTWKASTYTVMQAALILTERIFADGPGCSDVQMPLRCSHFKELYFALYVPCCSHTRSR
jgi:hypothetical protein